jgi:hypothetical protein
MNSAFIKGLLARQGRLAMHSEFKMAYAALLVLKSWVVAT